MSDPRLVSMLSMLDELEKTAGVKDTLANLGRQALLTAAGDSGYLGRVGRMALLGGIVGSAADEEHALRGALIGGGLGAAGMGSIILATKSGREAAGRGLRNFYARQKYSLTGQGIKDLEEAEKVKLVPKLPDKMPEGFDRGWVDKMMGRSKEEAWARHIESIKRDREAFSKGLLTLPGILRHPIQAFKSGWQRTPTSGKLLIGGLGAMDVYSKLKSPDTPRGRLEGVGRTLGGALGALATPFNVGGLLLTEGASQAGKYLGRGAGHLVERFRPGTLQAPDRVAARVEQ